MGVPWLALFLLDLPVPPPGEGEGVSAYSLCPCENEQPLTGGLGPGSLRTSHCGSGTSPRSHDRVSVLNAVGGTSACPAPGGVQNNSMGEGPSPHMVRNSNW